MAKIETTANIVQVYVLLNENYVEDDDNMFRFDYRWIDNLIKSVSVNYLFGFKEKIFVIQM